MTTADRLEHINQLAREREESWEKIFSQVGNHDELQQAVHTCNAIEGAEKSARFLAKALGTTPLGVTLTWLVDELDRLRAPYVKHQRTPELILSAVCDEFGVSVEQLTSESRAAELVVPRQTAMYLMRILLKLSLVDIGRAIHRDHATVIYGIEQTLGRKRKSPTFTEIIERLEARLRSTLEPKGGTNGT